MKSPCMGCEERYVGCHGKCVKYTNFRSKLDNVNQKIAVDNISKFYAGEHRERIKQSQHKKIDGGNKIYGRQYS